MQAGEVLAIEPQAVDFSYLYTGQVPNDRTQDGVAIVTIHGPLEHHRTFWWDSYEAIVQRIEDAMTGQDLVQLDAWMNGWKKDYEELAAIPARAIVLKIDSPGGEAAGATWAHRKIRALSKKHGIPIYAYANEMACSAAYELACAADEIWLPDTGTVGSIGVIATLFDRTSQNRKTGVNIELIVSGEQKVDHHADRPITDDIRDRLQVRVMQLADVFWGVVSKSRTRSLGTLVSKQNIADLEAGVFIGQTAVDVGIADGVLGWDAFLRMVTRSLDEPELDDDAAMAVA
jgi:ClpP class serine protease